MPHHLRASFFKTAVTTYTIHGQACHAVDFAKYFAPRVYTHFEARASTLKVMLGVTLRVPDGNTSYLDVHVMARGDLHSKVIGRRVRHKQFMRLAYAKQELHLLPPPYATKCRDYRAEGLQSQEDCIAQCAKKEAQSRGAPTPLMVPVVMGENVIASRAHKHVHTS